MALKFMTAKPRAKQCAVKHFLARSRVEELKPMRLFNVTPLALVCALSLSPIAAPGFAPPAVADNHEADTIVSTSGKQDAPPSAAPAADDAQQTNASAPAAKHENAFLHALAAPFRALARLFSGGKKTTQAKSAPNPQPTPPATKTTQPTTAVAAQTTPEPKQKNRTQQVAQTQPTATTQATARRNAANAKPTRSSGPVAPSAPPPSLADAPALPTPAPPDKFTPVIEGVPLDPLSQGRALLERGETGAAIAVLSVAAVTGPDLLGANNLLGVAYDRIGQHKQAQEYYTRALTFAPNDAATLNNLGHSLYLDDHYNEALARLKQAARLLPNDPQIANNLALVYGRLHKYDDAYRQFARAGGEFYARMQTGALLEAAGRDRDAIKHFEAARRLDPTNSEALRHLINLYVRTGQPGKAEDARRLLNNKPENKHAESSSSSSSV
jgi:Flp pilus assembly protein TadD